MDALCDPRAFLSAQEKRAEQLKAMGIEESDIDTSKVIQSKGPEAKKDEKKKDEGTSKSILKKRNLTLQVGPGRNRVETIFFTYSGTYSQLQ